MLEESRPADADVRSRDDDAIGVAAQPAARGAETELLAIGAAATQVEAGLAQPADAERLELVAGVEHAQDAGAEVAARVLRRVGDLVDQLPRAGLADAAAAEVVARALAAVAGHQSGIHEAR